MDVLASRAQKLGKLMMGKEGVKIIYECLQVNNTLTEETACKACLGLKLSVALV